MTAVSTAPLCLSSLAADTTVLEPTDVCFKSGDPSSDLREYPWPTAAAASPDPTPASVFYYDQAAVAAATSVDPNTGATGVALPSGCSLHRPLTARTPDARSSFQTLL